MAERLAAALLCAALAGGCAAPGFDGRGRGTTRRASDPVHVPGGDPGPTPADAYATASQRWAAVGVELLEHLNAARRAAGVPALPLDPAAQRFAEAEAARLVREGELSHRAADGSRPHQRWARRGGVGMVAENLFRLRASGERAYAAFEPERGHARLMRSRGHRRTILDPAWTGAGVAVAWDRERNAVVVVQEFVARHAELDAGAADWRPGEGREVTGRLLTAGFAPWMAVLRREGPQRDGDEPVAVIAREAFAYDAASGAFRVPIRLPADADLGEYSLTLYVRDRRLPEPDGPRSTTHGVPGGLIVLGVSAR